LFARNASAVEARTRHPHPAELDADHGKLHVELLQFFGMTNPELADRAVIVL
jgi:hypothetical protein